LLHLPTTFSRVLELPTKVARHCLLHVLPAAAGSSWLAATFRHLQHAVKACRMPEALPGAEEAGGISRCIEVLQHVMEALQEVEAHAAGMSAAARRAVQQLVREAEQLRVELLGEEPVEKLPAGLSFVWVDSPLVKALREGHWVGHSPCSIVRAIPLFRQQQCTVTTVWTVSS
jgi:hypothetical protein